MGKEFVYEALAKWEWRRYGHSPGYLYLSRDYVLFVPHEKSILERAFGLRLDTIDRVQRSDNWLWRGAVNVYLKQEFEFEFNVNPSISREQLHSGEKTVFCSNKLRFFLGSNRREFLVKLNELLISTEEG